MLMRQIDEQFLETPFFGVRQMTCHLRNESHLVNEKRTRRLMRLMGLMPIYQKLNTSKAAKGHKTYPYLLHGLWVNPTAPPRSGGPGKAGPPCAPPSPPTPTPSAPTLADIQTQGHTTLRAIAAELNTRDILARRGGKWHVSNVKRLVERLGELKLAGPGSPVE